MKKILITLSVLASLACNSDPIEKLISDYEQTIGETKIDLSLQIQELKLISEYTTKDSINFFDDLYNQSKSDRIEHLEGLISTMKKEIESTEFQELIDNFSMKIREYEAEILAVKNNSQPTYLMKEIQKDIDRLKAINQPLFGYIYECKYTIKNPLLNNVKQELTGRYLISPERNAIIRKIEKEDG